MIVSLTMHRPNRPARDAHPARLALLALVVVSACNGSPEPEPPATGAIVTLIFPSHPEDTLRALVTREATIAQVRDVLAGRRTAAGPSGPIRRGAGVDPRYPFHFLPDSLELTESTIELCDAEPMRTPAAVDAFIAGSTGSAESETATWCPWGAVPIALEQAAIP